MARLCRRDRSIDRIHWSPCIHLLPRCYASKKAVPTWNYAAVHVYGYPQIIEDRERVAALLEETVSFYERSFESPWPGILPDRIS